VKSLTVTKQSDSLYDQQIVDISWLEFTFSLSLVAVTLLLSVFLKLQIEKSLFVASVRAALQLLAVGLFFTAIFEHGFAELWSWLWVTFMVLLATSITRKRVPTVKGLSPVAFIAITSSVVMVDSIVFFLTIIEYTPINIVVISGITVGNIVPSTVLAVQQLNLQLTSRRSEAESLLALGADKQILTKFFAPEIIKTALTTQIERTKVVGLIALPGAMTGLLLAGTEPMDAVLIQLIVMYMILGSATVTVCIIVWFGLRLSLTKDLRLTSPENTI
jgi:putative ABC transport system permease protein|tara:strand:- start:109429 stop:110253 length:825 start_codon:yes stop_codon:yes gene_type:complete